MLGSDVFAFETPNVIDPGDMPPSQPGRKAPTAATSTQLIKVAEKPTYQANRTQQLLFTIDDDSNSNIITFQDDSSHETKRFSEVEEKKRDDQSDYRSNDGRHQHRRTANGNASRPWYSGNDEDESRVSSSTPEPTSIKEEEDNTHSLPAIEEARTYAMLLLNSVNDRRTVSSGDGTSSRDPFAQSSSVRSHKNIDRNHRKLSQTLFRRKVFAFSMKVLAVFLPIIIFSLIVASVVKTKKARQDNTPPPSRIELTTNFVHQFLLTPLSDLMTPGTPQYMAANWIAHMDALALDVPKALDDSAVQFVQRFVLAVFYYSTQGTESWINKAGFLSDESECGWYDAKHRVPNYWGGGTYALGVTCDLNLQVENLLLPSNSLKGSLPAELGYLTGLTILSLPHNQLRGTIPNTLVNLTNLLNLDLQFNLLNGRVPNSFDSLGELQVLALSNNNLEQSLPPSFKSLSSLKTLALDDNIFTGDVSTINSMSSLERLYADRNSFAGQVNDSFLNNLPNLKELDLSGNRFTSADFFPKHLLQHGKLKIFDMGANMLKTQIPSNLQQNSVLSFLSLRDNQLVGSISSTSLPMLSNLYHLDISGNRFQGSLPDALQSLKNVSELFVGHNPLLSVGPIPSWLFSLEQLTELGMNDMNLAYNIPVWMEKFTWLKFLDLSNNGLKGSVPAEVFYLRNLQFLMLHNNSLTGEIPQVSNATRSFRLVTLFNNGFGGNMTNVCNIAPSLELLAVDCSAICDKQCCPRCCNLNNITGGNSSVKEYCFEDAIPTYLQYFEGLWELNYTRPTSPLNPSLISDQPSYNATKATLP